MEQRNKYIIDKSQKKAIFWGKDHFQVIGSDFAIGAAKASYYQKKALMRSKTQKWCEYQQMIDEIDARLADNQQEINQINVEIKDLFAELGIRSF